MPFCRALFSSGDPSNQLRSFEQNCEGGKKTNIIIRNQPTVRLGLIINSCPNIAGSPTRWLLKELPSKSQPIQYDMLLTLVASSNHNGPVIGKQAQRLPLSLKASLQLQRHHRDVRIQGQSLTRGQKGKSILVTCAQHLAALLYHSR